MQNNGLLTTLDLAFSRDQAESIYVQDRMRERGLNRAVCLVGSRR